jgi:hypothetical protein
MLELTSVRSARSRAAGHVAASEPTSAGRYNPKLQHTWQRVDAQSAHYLDLELICGYPIFSVPTVSCESKGLFVLVFQLKIQKRINN